MKALVKYAPGEGNVEVREVAEPSPGPQQVKVEVKAAGICGSDLHIYHNDIKLTLNPPVIMGHEFAGVVLDGELTGDTAQVPGPDSVLELVPAMSGG